MQRITATMAKELCKRHDIHILVTSGKSDGNIYNIPEEIPVTIHELSLPRKVIRNFFNYIAKKGFFNRRRVKSYKKLMFLKKQRDFLIDFIYRNKFDLVIGFDNGSDFWMASVKDQVEVPMIGVIQASYEHFFGSPSRGNYNHEWIFQHLLGKLDRLIVLSDDDRRSFAEKLGLDTVKVYNAHDMAYDQITGLTNKKFIALGRCAHHKGFDILVEGFKIFAEKNSEWSLEIIGDGPMKAELQEKVAEYKLSQRVSFHPYTNNVQAHLAAASVFVFSSRSEGFGIVQVEAMSCGLPIVASTIPVTAEILSDRGLAIFYETESPQSLAAAMNEIIQLDLAQMSQRALSYSKNFTAEEIGKQYESIFYEVVKCVPEYNI
ncbi:glycosyltransferase [Litoribacter ruber]|nr:glycosyltransferase [Litoribacter alkaliphilus]